MFCPVCGKEMQGNKCEACGYTETQNQFMQNQQIPNQPMPNQPMQNQPIYITAPPPKKNHGCLIAVLVVIAFFFLIIIVGSGSDDDDKKTEESKAPVMVSGLDSKKDGAGGSKDKVSVSKADDDKKEDDDKLETTVKLHNSYLTKDYEGKDVLVVEYEYTNGEDEPESFMWAFDAKAYQNGIECDNMVFLDFDEDLENDNADKEIQPGVTCIVAETYLLQDMSDVELKVTDFVFDDEYLSETIKLQ